MSSDELKGGENSGLESNPAAEAVSSPKQPEAAEHNSCPNNSNDRPEISSHLGNAQDAEASGDLAKALEQYCFVLAFAALPNPSKADSRRAIRALVKAYAFSSLEKLAVFRKVTSTIAPTSAIVTLIDETLNRYSLTLPEELEESWTMTDLVDRLELPGVISGWRISWHIDTVLREFNTDLQHPSVSAYAAMRSTTIDLIDEVSPETIAEELPNNLIAHDTNSGGTPTVLAPPESFEDRIDLANDINRNAGAIIAPQSYKNSTSELPSDDGDQIATSLPVGNNWAITKSNGNSGNAPERSLVSGYISAAELFIRQNKKDLAKPFIEDGLELESDNPTLLKLYRELGD